MKKFLLMAIIALTTAISALAIPRGMYCDDRGNNRVLVSDNGKEIYFLDSDGRVTRTLEVVSENSDGSFTTRETSTGIVHYNNEYWYEDGVCYLNLAWKRVTLHRQ